MFRASRAVSSKAVNELNQLVQRYAYVALCLKRRRERAGADRYKATTGCQDAQLQIYIVFFRRLLLLKNNYQQHRGFEQGSSTIAPRHCYLSTVARGHTHLPSTSADGNAQRTKLLTDRN